MNAKQKAIKYLKENKCYSGDDESKWYLPFIESSLDIAIKEVKKEVFDDIEKYKVKTGCIIIQEKSFDILKKKHLPPN